MTPADQRAKEVFLGALEVRPEEREAYIAGHCEENAELMGRVEALLGAHSKAETLNVGASGLGTRLQPPGELQPGDSVGPYVIRDFLGEGGFGLVFLAEQERPVRRSVALKLIKAGMDSRQIIRRFEAERQALGIMDHPNIARVLDAGTTSQGRPYFVMEYVPGVPATEFCAKEELGTRERLELFRSVCLALQHAHQKGVIHRDIKPSNVLVSSVDGVPVPKVIDFGIAKAIERPLIEESLVTGVGTIVGTPAYMSPEQVAGTGDVDTRSDVYSLGALLYEMLTGEPPFPSSKLRSLLVYELQRMIREDDPPPPSLQLRRTKTTRVGTSTTVQVSSELDWIVMKCLEKDRNRRYLTANALAEDVSRYLRHEAVEAAPPAPWYRLRKLLRRHRMASTLLLAIVLGLGLAASGAGFGMLEARKALDVAKTSAATARREQANVMRLSMFERLEDLVVRADDLWPAAAELVDTYEGWLREAAAVVASLHEEASTGEAGHRAMLADLDARGARTDEDSWWRNQLEKLVAEIEAFSDPETGLIEGLSPTGGWGVARRLEFARTIEERSVSGEQAAALWSEAIEEIGAMPEYGGLELAPQLGLLPLGPDPEWGYWEFAHLASGEVPERDGRGNLVLTEATCIVLVLVPGDTFDMGGQASDPSAPNYDPLAQPDEGPVHEVSLAPFFLSKYEMTQGQWLRFAGKNPSRYDPSQTYLGARINLLHPVEMVSWDECVTQLGRMGLGLPTEAQWEYAARAGSPAPWWTGEERDDLEGAVNLADQAGRRGGGRWPAMNEWPELDDGWASHAPVGSYLANPFGLHDVLGNVWEWCRDAYFDRYDSQSGGVDPLVLPDEDGSMRVDRGGGFANGHTSARSSNRDMLKSDSRLGSLGVRPARALD